MPRSDNIWMPGVGQLQCQALDSHLFHPHQPDEVERLITSLQLRKPSSGKKSARGLSAGVWQSFWLQSSCACFL